MNVNEVKLSTDEDFDKFYSLIHEEDNWVVKYNKNNTKVCSKWTDASRIKMIKVDFYFLMIFFKKIFKDLVVAYIQYLIF